MSDKVILLVLTAALLHATWNAVVKNSGDKLVSVVAVVVGHVPFALITLLFVEAPANQSWGWLLVGIALHVGYQLFLGASYRFGDLSQVYPIARGVAPLLVTLISVLFLGVLISQFELAAIVIIVIGISSVCLIKNDQGAMNRTGVVLALITGSFIAAYSLVDGIGARLSGSALGFYAWLAIGNAALLLLATSISRRRMLKDVLASSKLTFWFGGGASYAAYALVIWAFTQAPIAMVTALRETSIVFALLIGVIHLKEKLSLYKVCAIVITLAGAALLRLAS